MKLSSLALAILLFAPFAHAETVENEITTKSPYEISEKKKLTLGTSLEVPTHSILISTGLGRSNSSFVKQRVQWNPTMGPNIGIHIGYGGLSAYINKRFSMISDKDATIYGRSDYDDYRIGYQLNRYVNIDTYYQNYRGFYADLSGQEGLKTTIGSGVSASTPTAVGPKQIINKADMAALNYGVRVVGALPLTDFLRGFSSEESYTAQNWQLNILGKLYYNRQGITSDSGLVPDAVDGSLSPIASLKEFWSNTLGAGVGLGCVFPVTQSFTFGLESILGTGLQRQNQIFSTYDHIAYTTAKEMNANLFAAWKYPEHSFRAGFYLDSFSSEVEGINLDTTSLGLNFLYTYSGFNL